MWYHDEHEKRNYKTNFKMHPYGACDDRDIYIFDDAGRKVGGYQPRLSYVDCAPCGGNIA